MEIFSPVSNPGRPATKVYSPDTVLTHRGLVSDVQVLLPQHDGDEHLGVGGSETPNVRRVRLSLEERIHISNKTSNSKPGGPSH